MRFCITSVLMLFASCGQVPSGPPIAISRTQPAFQVTEVTDADLPASVAIEEHSSKSDEASQESNAGALGYVLGPGYRYRNLTIFPLMSTAALAEDELRVITLDEGLRAGTVTVHEIG